MRNFKKIGICGIVLVLCIGINLLLNYLLIPYSYVQINLHNIQTKAYDDVFLGTSHGFAGIDPLTVDEVTGRRSTNLCQGGEYPQDAYFLLKEICRYHKPKRVIYELDSSYWITKPNQDGTYSLTYSLMPWSWNKLEYFFDKIWSADFRSTLFPWYNYRNQIKNIRKNIAIKTSDSCKNYGTEPFEDTGQKYMDEGFMYIYPQENAKKEEHPIHIWNENELIPKEKEMFEKMVSFCEQESIELVVITTPLPEETFMKYKKELGQANAYFSNLMEKNKVKYLDFNFIDLSDFDNGIANYSDYEGHMYGETGKKFSRILADYLKE